MRQLSMPSTAWCTYGAGSGCCTRRGGGSFRWREPGWHLAGPLPTLQVFLVKGGDALRVDPSHPAALPFETLGAGLSSEKDVAAIRARRAQQLRSAPLLAATGALLFAVLFAVLPVTVYRVGATSADVGRVAAVAAILWGAVVAVAARALTRAGSTRREALAALAPALLFPPAAAHVLSFIWRDSFRAWSPLAVASVLLGPADFRRVARQELRRLDEAARRTSGTELEADTRVRRDAVTRLLAGLGIDPVALAAGEAPQDALAAVFCPLCEAEYRAGFVRCADCGVGLRPFAPSRDPSGSPAPR